MYESPYSEEETEDMIAQVNELRSLLAACWKLLPDGDYGSQAVMVKKGMTKYACWPDICRITDSDITL